MCTLFSKIEKRILKNVNPKAFGKIKSLWVCYVLPQRNFLIFSIIFMGVYSVSTAWSVSLLKPVFDKVFIERNIDVLALIAVQVVIAFGLKGFSQYMQSVTMIKLGANFTRKLQGDLYDKFVAQDLDFFGKNNSGNLLIYFTNDLNTIRDVVINSVTTLVRDVCSIVLLVALMFWYNFNMAITMFIFFPIGFYPVVYFGKKIRKIFHKQQNSFGNLYAILTQSFQGIKIVKSYNMEAVESKKVRDSADAIAKIEIKMAKNNNVLSPLMEFLGGVAAAGTLAYGGYKITQGILTTGDFVVFLTAVVAAYQPMKSLANLNSRLQMGVAATERVLSAMDQTAKLTDKVDAKMLKVGKGIIKIENVKFGYIPNVEILHGINLEVKEGEKIAIVGPAGSGKSTLINLILRFYDVKEGSIKIDGEDIRDVTIKSLRNNIAFVSQNVVLFDDTIKRNILIGKIDATDEEVITAAENASAHGFIMNQNQGYDTIVGEKGDNLSGGQKQTISIARAMLKNAPILLLDEATSSLDSKSEKIVQMSLERLMSGRTSIVIAHRLSTIVNADRIYVFESGNIVEVGAHKELLALNGYYAKLYKVQFVKN